MMIMDIPRERDNEILLMLRLRTLGHSPRRLATCSAKARRTCASPRTRSSRLTCTRAERLTQQGGIGHDRRR